MSPPGATIQTIGGLLPSTLFFFVVRAEDSSGNEEGNLVEVSATTMATPDTTAPVFGGVTSASVVSPIEIRLMWNAASDDRSPPSQIVYNIYLATASGGQNFAAPSATTAPGATSETVTGLSPDTDHFLVVRAVDTSGNEEGNTVEIQGRTLVSFMAQAEPIFTGNCALSGCHAGAFPQQGMNLSSFAMIDSTAINVLANETAASTMLFRIQPFDSAASYLVHKIDGTQLSVGGSGAQMPFGAPPLSQEDRDIVRMWIDQGALNN